MRKFHHQVSGGVNSMLSPPHLIATNQMGGGGLMGAWQEKNASSAKMLELIIAINPPTVHFQGHEPFKDCPPFKQETCGSFPI